MKNGILMNEDHYVTAKKLPSEKTKPNSPIHVWEKLEIELQANNEYSNPYMDVDIWVDLQGPNYSQRVFGFWDGGNTYKIRFLAVEKDTWSYITHSNQDDFGLNGFFGEFEAIDWTANEKKENRCRRGMVIATENGHAFQFVDGTPFYLLGDTWWATPTDRFKWFDDDRERGIGPEMGFKDMVKYRKQQGFNCIAMIASFPTWANDGLPHYLVKQDEPEIGIRDAWRQPGTDSAKDMHNEGGRPFNFPGLVKGYENVVPNYNKINPVYFRYLDKKIDYLNQQGFIPFIEVARRDVSVVWKKYYNWPDSYARYIRYIYARYQANICIFSPIHFDWLDMTIPSKEYNGPANMVVEEYGRPPFGTLQGTNSSPSSLVHFGSSDEAKWLTFHQIGNWRDHDYYWYLTEIFNSEPKRPALNGEPYYPGYPFNKPHANSEEANLNFRSSLYGSFLSGGLAGFIYGIQGLWSADNEDEAEIKMWEALTFTSGGQVAFIENFISEIGKKYIELIPNPEMVTPNKAGPSKGHRGWAFCASTRAKDIIMIYCEKDCPNILARGTVPDALYYGKWFNPRTGDWFIDDRIHKIESNAVGWLKIPNFPSNRDWGLLLSSRSSE